MFSKEPNIDYIIVGQGIAGSTLAFRMLEAGLRIKVIDIPRESSGSRVAAGIVNPVTGRKLVKSWMIDALLVEVEALYRKMEERLGISCLNSIPIYKLFSSVKEQNDWLFKREDAAYNSYLSPVFYPDWPGVDTTFGVGTIHHAYWLDIRLLIDSMQSYLLSKGVYEAAEFDFRELDTSDPKHVRYKGEAVGGIIFCDGYQGIENPLFGHLPLSFAKGEIMIVDCPELAYLDGILNKNGFVIPMGNGRFKVGATFHWHDKTPEPTESGKEQIVKKFRNICSHDLTVLKVEAAFRPTVRDRRPLLGASARHGSVYNFNGMGTKGVSLAAWFSKHLLEHICENKPLLSEVDIHRFKDFQA